MGYKKTGLALLTAAEQELARLNAASRQAPATSVYDSGRIRTRIKAMAAELQAALAADIPVARDVLSKKLGDIVVENVTTACMPR